jgi:gliding motility-associated-like protein
VPSAADKTAGSVTLTLTSTNSAPCTPESAQMILTITPAPTISAGPDLIRCADAATVPVTGTKNAVVSSILWSRVGGGGTFSSTSSLSMNYTPSAADTTAHLVKLVITSVGTGTCATISDTMSIAFTPAPLVNPGTPQTVCADTAFITLSGAVTAAATGGTWSGGAGGVYSPNNTSLTTSYFPTAADTAAGFINFTLTTSGQGTCNAVSKSVLVTINHAPVVSAGPDKAVCADVTGVLLNGAFVNNAGGGTWTSNGSGTFLPNANTVLATYNFSAADKTGGVVTLTLVTQGNGSCKAKSDQVILTITTAPTVSAGPSRTICADAVSVPVTGSVTLPATGGTWTTAGTGTFANANALSTNYTPSAGDKTLGSVILTFTTTTGLGTCQPVSDTMKVLITPVPTADAGPAQTICADAAGASLNGIVTVATGGTWTSNGTGTFSPNATTLTATYIPSAAERATTVNIIRTLTLTTTGNGTCNPVTSNMDLTITPAPTVDAGASISVCGNNAAVALNGILTVATIGKWTTAGTGTFGDPNSLITNYTPTATDISNGSVDLVLTTVDNGTCNAVSSTKIVAITGAPVVSAGANRSVCANNPTVSLIGSITAPATGGTWSSIGTGTFSPNANTLVATYTPSAAEILAGTTTLTLTSTGNANCNPVSSSIVVTITAAPTVNPGAAQAVCANNASIPLNGIVTVATGGDWTTNGSGTFTPNANTLITTYTPSAADTLAHGVTLTLTTSGNGTCNAVSATKVITITPAPIINAGSNLSICADLASVTLNGGRTVATGSTWTTAGTGTFNDATLLNATYTPSATDKTNGAVSLTLTPNGFGNCALVTDQIIINIAPAPTVNAGSDQIICADKNNISLNGVITGATGGTWTTSSGAAQGVFSPGETSLVGFYIPSATERTAGVPITLTLTSTGNGSCNPVTSSFILTITPAPTVDAGTDQTVCADIAGVALNGAKTVSTGATWTSAGAGTFAPNSSTLNATYTPSAAEKTAGLANLTLTTNGSGTCMDISSQMKITITPAPTVNAGPNLSMCADGGSIVVNGSVTVATGGVWSTTSGTGTFAPDANTLLMTFTPSALQITQGFARLTLTTTGNGTCIPVSQQMQITIAPIPVVNAGPNQTVCADAANVPLAGTVTNATGGTWTTNGTGSFSPNANTLNASYVPSIADKVAGTITLTLTSTGNGKCNTYSSFMTLRITPIPTVDAGPAAICSSASSIALSGIVTNSAGGTWSTSSVSVPPGTFSPSSNVLNTSYIPSAGDFAAGGVTLRLTTAGTGACAAVFDNINVVLQGAPTANAGSDAVVCANNNAVVLTGVVGGAATGGTWTSTGGGVFSPNANTLAATYTPSAIDMVNGNATITLTTTGVGVCNTASDIMKVTITPAPTANAGANRTICADAAGVTLAGTVTVATGGTWTTNGSGTFLPDANTLNATYIPSNADTTAHSVTLTLTTTGNGLCNQVSSQMVITITPAPHAISGPDYIICADAGGVGLSGVVTSATGGHWTSTGSGTFGDANDLNTLYTFSNGDRTTGSVKLILTTTGIGTCNAFKDTMNIVIPPAPIVTASALNSCSDAPSIPLSGSVTFASGGKWTSNSVLGGTFTPDNITLNGSYVPGPGESSVVLTLTSTGNGTCNAVATSFTLNIQAAPTANANGDQILCKNKNAVILDGIIGGGATQGIWTTIGGTGFFAPNNTALNGTYSPSAADLTAGTLTFILTSTDNGICSADIDTMVVTFTPAPTVDAGPAVVCSQIDTLVLNGTFTVASGIKWTSTGSGTFLPDDVTANATYHLSAADLSSPSISLTLTTNAGLGNCNAVSDVMLVNIANSPTAVGGGDKTVCANNRNVTLNGSVLVSTTGIWSTTTDGTFSAPATTLNNTYRPSDADTAAGTVKLVLTTTDNGVCSAVTDTVIVTITDAPVINLGPATVCSNNPPLLLNASLTVATTGTWTSSSGGAFGNPPTTLNNTYTPSGTDIGNGQVTLTFTTDPTASGCVATQKSVTLFITGAPTAVAGIDKIVCADTSAIPLNGTISGATGGEWSIVSGTGTLSPLTGVNPATYSPSAADTAAGSVKLVLTTTGNGSCIAHTDTLNISITDAPTIDAGPDQIICADKSTINLNGLITTSSGGNWTTSGAGTFGNAALKVTTYSPSSTVSPVNLILTSSGNGNCRAVKDTVVLTITPAPTVNATPKVICTDDAAATLSGAVTVASGGTWTSSSPAAIQGIFAPNANTLNASYIITAGERAAGSVTLYLTSTGNGTCNAVRDSIIWNIVPTPTADAGADQSICAAAGTVSLSGSVVTATGGIWSTLVNTGGTYAPNANTLTTSYNLTSADTAAHIVTFVLTTTGNNGCIAGSDSVTIFMTPAPVAIVNAGLDQVVCSDISSVDLNGNIQNAAGGAWITSGNGIFTPNAFVLNAQYLPDAVDKASVTPIRLILTSIGNGICNPVRDTMFVTITPAPTVTVDPDRTICADVASISLTAVPTVATDGFWTTSGGGGFAPNNKNAIYSITPADISDSTVIFTFETSVGNGTCIPVTANTKIFITPAPTVEAGPNQIVCADNKNVLVNGAITVATAGQWTTSGDGTFANANNLSTVYTPGVNDLTAGTIKLFLTSTIGNGTCIPVKDSLLLTITTGPTVDPGAPQTICADASGVNLAGSVTIASGGAWTTGGSGSFFPNNVVLTGTYVPSAADTAAHSVTLTLTSTGNGTCNAVDSTVIITITPTPIVSAGVDQSTCKDAVNIPLDGKIITATGGLWTTSGSGSFDPDAITLTSSYTPSTADTTAGLVILTLKTTTGNLTCNPVSDQMRITLAPTPYIYAGSDVTVCADIDSVSLNGTVTLATGGLWSIVPGFGSGTISNATNLSTAYKPSALDITNGLVRLVLTTTGNNGCNPHTDTTNITITPAPTVDAGLPQPICADASGVTLNGSKTVATGAEWTTSGSGVFAPNPDVTNAFYTPSAADRTSGLVTLYLTTTGNGSCRAVKDSVKISITPAPTVDAGLDQSVCGNNAGVSIAGTKAVATATIWSTSGSGTFAAATSLATTYTPSAADITTGSVTLTLTTTAQGTCNSVFDRMIVTITDAPVANPGSAQTVCGNNAAVKLNGSVSVATGGIWSSKGTGTFSPNDSTLVTTYNASAADIAAGSVRLKLTTTGNSNCNAVSDSVLVTITIPPTASITVNTICADAAFTALTGNVTVATGGTWTSTGTGTFAVNTSDLTGSYFPSTADRTAGTVGLTLTTTGNGNCLSVVANKSFTIARKPVVSAGVDKVICADASSVFITGTVTPAGGVAGAGTGTWSTSGTGTFSPNNTTLATSYVPSAADIAGGIVNLTLTSGLASNGSCNAVTDVMSVTITKAPTAEAGPNKTICADAASFGLNGTITVASGATWTTSGTGNFTPNANSVNVSYQPSAADTTAHSIILTMTTTGNGTCNAVKDSMILTIPPAPVVSTGGGSVCSDLTGLSLNGTVLNAGGGEWSTSGSGVFSPNAFTLGVSYSPSLADIAAGSVVLTLTSTGNGTCVPVSSSANVVITPLPVSDAGPDRRICRGSSIGLLPNSLNINNSYKWFTVSGVQLSGSMLANVTANSDTLYVLMATDQKGCSTRDTVEVFVVDPPVFTLANHFCLVNGLVMNSNPNPVAPVGGGTYQWFENSNPMLGENDPQALPVGAVGTYIIEYKFGTCAVYDTTIVTLPPQLYSSDTLTCIDQLLTIKTTNVPGASYTWSTTAPATIISTAPYTFTVDVRSTNVPNDSTNFIAAVTDNLGCVSHDTIEVKTVPLPTLVLPSDTSVCFGDTLVLIGQPDNISNTLSRYTWFRNGLNLNVPDTTSQLHVSTAGKYLLMFGIGGCSAKDSANLVINPKPELHVADVTYCFDNGAFTDLDAGAGHDTYNWYSMASPDSLATRVHDQQKFTVFAPGRYYMTVTNSFGCAESGSIYANSVCRPDLNPPTGFFPDNNINPGDCAGDPRCQDLLFRPYGNFTHAVNVQFTVFNRWGEIIFYTDDISKGGWDGTYRGELMPTGTYPWTLYYEGNTEEFKGPYKKSGSVTIIK